MTADQPTLTPHSPSLRVHPAAVWSLVLGILSIFCLWIIGSIPAIICGIVALRRIQAAPAALTGRGLAIGGIVTGGVGILVGLVSVAIFSSVSLPAYNQVRQKAELTRQMNNARMTAVAIQAYATEHDGQFPPSLETLVPDYLGSSEYYEFEDPVTGERMPFLYRPGLTTDSEADQPVLMAPRAIAGERILVNLDGSVERIPEPPGTSLLKMFGQT